MPSSVGRNHQLGSYCMQPLTTHYSAFLLAVLQQMAELVEGMKALNVKVDHNLARVCVQRTSDCGTNVW